MRDNQPSPGTLDSTLPRWYSVAFRLYLACVVAFAVWICWRANLPNTYSPFEWSKAGWLPPPAARVVYVLGVVALGGVPFFPPIGLIVYVVLMYGFARYAPELEFVYVSRLPEIVLGLSLAGWCLWNQRGGWTNVLPRSVATVALAGLLMWELVAASVAAVFTDYWPPHISHEPTRLVEAGIGFLIAATSLTDRKSTVLFVVMLTITLAIRECIWREFTYLDGDISALLAMTIPLVLGAAVIATRVPWKLVLCCSALYLTWLLATTENRAAGLGIAAAILVILLNLSRRLIWLTVAIALVMAAIPFARETSYWNRFSQHIYRDGKFIGSAGSRLEIWEVTWKTIKQRPLFGSGPGSVSRIIGEDPRIGRYVAHNNYLELLAETGVPGLLLYLVFFTAVFVSAWRLQRENGAEWQGRLAKYLMASLAAYLTFGLFISRQDLVLAYVVAGIIVGTGLKEMSTAEPRRALPA